MKAILCAIFLALAVTANIMAGPISPQKKPIFKEESTAKKPPAKPRPETESQVDLWLAKSGFKYKKAGPGVWVIRVAGKILPSYQIIIASGPAYVLATVVIADKNNLKFDSDLGYKLLRLSHKLDYLKVGFDDDDDLFVRAEARSSLLDADEFKAMLDRLGIGAEMTYDLVQPFIVKRSIK